MYRLKNSSAMILAFVDPSAAGILEGYYTTDST